MPRSVAWITLLGFLLRAVTATWTGLTTDEANGMAIAATGSWWDMIVHLQQDGNPPLFYIIMRAYTDVFGTSDIALKIFAVVLSSLMIPLFYFVSRRLVSHELSLQITMMLAFAAPVVRYSTMIRGYLLMPLLSMLSTWFFMRTLSIKGRRWPILYGISTTMLIYAHYWGAFIAVGQAATVLVGLVARWINKDRLKNWLFGVAVSIGVFVPWMPVFAFQMTHNLSPWAEPPLLSFLVFGLPAYFFIGTEYTSNFADQLSLIMSNLLIWGAVLSPIILIVLADYTEIRTLSSAEAKVEDAAQVRFDENKWKLVAVLSTLAGSVISLVKPVMRDRYFLPLTPLFTIVYLTSFYALFPRLPKKVRFWLPILLWVPFWLPQYANMHNTPETGTPAIVTQIKDRADRKKDLVVVSWPAISPAITFYLPQEMNVIVFPDLKRTQFNKWEGMNERLRDPERLHKLFDIMERTLNNGGKIWLVDWAHSIQTRNPEDETDMKTLRYQAADLRRQDQIRTWLALHADTDSSTLLAPGRDLGVFLTVYRPAAAPKNIPFFPAKPLEGPSQPGSDDSQDLRIR
jgi:mannosyltransferase